MIGAQGVDDSAFNAFFVTGGGRASGGDGGDSTTLRVANWPLYIDGKTIDLTPQTAAGAALTVSNIPTQVAQFKCGPGSTSPVPSKYLPGSCK